MKLKITQMLENMSFVTDLGMAYKGQLQDTVKASILYLENIEKFENNDDIKNYIVDVMDKVNSDVLIMPGWCFPKNTYEKLYSYYDYIINSNDDLYAFIIFEVPILFVIRGQETYKNFLSKMTDKDIKLSTLNVNNIVESDNGIEINYYTNTEFVEFREKPESILKREKEIKEQNG